LGVDRRAVAQVETGQVGAIQKGRNQTISPASWEAPDVRYGTGVALCERASVRGAGLAALCGGSAQPDMGLDDGPTGAESGARRTASGAGSGDACGW
jgi:hypothetical protein